MAVPPWLAALVVMCAVMYAIGHVQALKYERPLNVSTNRPVIGVLTLPVTILSQRKYGQQSFATSYVRWLEAGGARIAPIFFDSTTAELDYILNSVNGVFWTGGLVDFNPTDKDPEGFLYRQTTDHILEHVLKENRKGNFYPMWGTCLGFERLVQLLAHDVNASIIEPVDAENYAINLRLTESAWASRLFGSMSHDLFKEVASTVGKLAYNNHGLGIQPQAFDSNQDLAAQLDILSVDYDRHGKSFVSTVEGRTMPLYGSQWHPEKAPWEWSTQLQMDHNEKAVQFSNYLGRFFVNECKYNRNGFENETAEAQALVHNWLSRPTGVLTDIVSAYSGIYFFDTKKPWETLRTCSCHLLRIARH